MKSKSLKTFSTILLGLIINTTLLKAQLACTNPDPDQIIAGERFCTPPGVSVTASESPSFCKGSSVVPIPATSACHLPWEKNVTAITGTTAQNCSAPESGTYSIDVSNSCGGAASDEFIVTLNKKPLAASSPSGTASMRPGDVIGLIINTGNHPAYQWKKNGIEIPGATNSAFVVTTAGTYKVAVTTTGCSNTSKVTTRIYCPPQCE